MENNSSRIDWLIVRYAPVSLFSLRSTYATNKGGKTLLVPTPYSVKMALLDACFRAYPSSEAESAARQTFDRIKSQSVRVQPPAECIVQNTFVRMLQPARDEAEESTPSGPFSRTIVYREFVFFRGEMEIALGVDNLGDSECGELVNLALHINHFGKRGSFWQFLGSRKHSGPLPPGFSLRQEDITQYPLDVVGLYRVPEYLDEFGPKLRNAKDGFERVSTYGKAEIKLDQHRVLQLTLLPYERITGGRHFTYYRRTVPK